MSKLKQVVIASVGTRGDIDPFILIGSELAKRGYPVYFLSDQHYKTQIEAAGLIFISATTPDNYKNFVQDPASCDPQNCLASVFKHLCLGNMLSVYKALEQFAPEETLLIASRLMLGARLASESRAFKLLLISLQPVFLNGSPGLSSSNGNSFGNSIRKICKRLIFKLVIQPKIRTKINQLRQEVGLAKMSNDMVSWLFDNPLNYGLYPSWFCRDTEGLNINNRGFIHLQNRNDADLPDELKAFLTAGTPPLLATFGTGMLSCTELLKTSVSIARRLNRRIIVLTSFSHQVPPLNAPDEIHLSFVNLKRLLPHLSGIIHHGGIGTAALALAEGCPQLIVPLLFDQPDNAQRFADLGCALVLSPNEFNIENGSLVVNQLLTDQALRDKSREYMSQINFEQNEHDLLDLIESELIK